MTKVDAFLFRTFVYISNLDNASMPLRKQLIYLKAGRAPD